MEGLNVFLLAGFFAGAGFGLAIVTPGGLRNLAFLIGGIVFGAHFGHVNMADASGNGHMALCAAVVGAVLAACPYILIQEKKAEDEARRKRTTQDENTVGRLNKLFRSPPAEK